MDIMATEMYNIQITSSVPTDGWGSSCLCRPCLLYIVVFGKEMKSTTSQISIVVLGLAVLIDSK